MPAVYGIEPPACAERGCSVVGDIRTAVSTAVSLVGPIRICGAGVGRWIEQGRGILGATGGLVGGSKIVSEDLGVGVVGAQDAQAVGEVLLVQGDGVPELLRLRGFEI